MTLATIAVYTIINLSYFKYTSTYNKLLLPLDIKNMQKFSSSKYVLGRNNRFPINRKSKKQKLNTETDDIIMK